MKTETELLRLARQYDMGALAEVYDRYSPGLYRYAMRLLGKPHLAEDCVAETFTRFLQALKHGGGPQDHLQAYLYRVAHNWITDFYRQRRAGAEDLHAEAVADVATVEGQAERQIEAEVVRRAILELTPEQQQVIVLKYLHGWNNRQVAAALGKPVGAVKSLQHRGIQRLKRLLGEG